MSKVYWDSLLSKRLSRRRALATTSAAATGAAFLAACGGNNSTSGKQTNKSSLVAGLEDTSKQAKRGGIYKSFITSDAGSWDPHVRGVWFSVLGPVIFSRLTRLKEGLGVDSSGETVGDLAEGWEFSPDGLTATFKLRANAKWHNVAPVNGRGVDAQDVLATWDRWRKISSTRATIDNEVNPDAPVVSMASPDSRTVVMKLAFPAVSLPSLFSATAGQAFHILPREVDQGYDPRKVALGSGPFVLGEQVASSYIHVKRHPGYYDQERPYVDGVQYPIVSEYATGLAAFRSGQVLAYPVRAEEVVAVKHDVADLNMYKSPLALPATATHLFFGYKNNAQGMFRDKRLRQAFSLSIDRDLFADTWFNVAKYRDQGLPVDVGWSTSVPASEFTGWWLDPRGKDFGPNAKFFSHDVAEAKKLISAAGFAKGVQYKSTRAGGNYGPEYDRQIDVVEAMAADAGFTPNSNIVNYQNDFVPNYQSVRGEFEGIGWMVRPQSSTDPVDKFAEYNFSGSGPNFIGYDVNGKGDHTGDPYVDDLLRKSKTERDTNKRQQYLNDLQRYFGDQMYLIRAPSAATGFELAWPSVRSYGYFQGDPRGAANRPYYTWLDSTKAPLGSS